MAEIAPIRRQVVVPGPPRLAFEVWTDEIGQWWPVGQGHSVYGSGASVAFQEDRLVEYSPAGEVSVWGEVLEWQPPDRFAITWHPGKDVPFGSTVEVTFLGIADDTQTLVTLTHRGWEHFADPETARREYGKGWIFVLDRYVATRPATDVEAGEPVWLVLWHTVGPAAEGPVFGHPLFREHIAFLRRLAGEGVLVAAGSLPDTPGAGMTLIRVPEAKDVARYARLAQDEDRSVVEGLFQVQVRPWAVALAA